MIVKDVMNRLVIYVNKENTILDVMKIMREYDLGFIVIADDKKPIGVITDRDIVLGLSFISKLTDKIEKIMKKNIITIDQYSDINDASDLLGNMQIKRLVVVNELNELCGVLSIADLARHVLLEDNALEALTEISYDFNPKDDGLIQIDTPMV
ncbi:MAG: CBS domain-containing protein [bacterium]